jgi:hypothetical protein
MDIVKKNLLSILCGVVAVAAILAIPLYINAQKKDLQTQLDARKATHASIQQIQGRQRHLPIVSTDPNATAPDLGVFPGPAVIKAGEDAIAQVQKQSTDLEQAAVKMNVHTPLLPGSLPVPMDTFKFQQAYGDEMRKAIPVKLDAATPPTDAEIKDKIAQKEKELTDLAPKNNANGEVFDKDKLQNEIDQMHATLPDQLRRAAATEHKLYMAADGALSVDPDISTGGMAQAVTPEKVWLAQLGLWVQQDVVDAIVDLNKNSKAVADSTVKQVVRIEVSPDRDIYVLPSGTGATGTGATATPSPLGQAAASPVAANAATDPLPRDFSVSPTGRVCNGVFDVVQFSVALNVQASEVNKVIQGLERNRLLTVYQSDLQAVNSLELQQDGYYFGPHPMVTLTLKCEELFLRSWTRPLMPPAIKQYLNVQEPAPAQPTAMAN